MDQKQIFTEDGQEVTGEDIDRMGRVAARAEDRVFAELFRLRRTKGAASPIRVRGILPPGDNVKSNLFEPAGIVMPSGSADGTVRVHAFRAIVGSAVEQDDEIAEGDALEENRYALASGVHCGEDETPYTEVLLTPADDPRFDLIYATLAVDVDGPTVERQVKGLDEETETTELAVYLRCTVSINVVEGAESPTPTRPAVPSDSAGLYNFPLAFVRVPAGFSGLSTVESRGWIQTVAPLLSLAPAVGGFDLRPATVHQAFPTSNDTDLASDQASAPKMCLPSDWAGGNQRLLMLDTDEMALGEPVLLDNSLDWRKRIGKATVVSSEGANVAWAPGDGAGAASLPSGRSGAVPTAALVFNTFVADEDEEVLFLNASTGLQDAGTAELSLTVSPSTGDLYGTFHADIGEQRVFLWLEMTASLNSFAG